MKELPIGIQDYAKLREENYMYVDKTRRLYELARLSTPFFFSRPRRFGKSLIISTLENLFRGHRHLFTDTWIEQNWNFQSFPVIRITMSGKDTGNVKVFLHNCIDDLIRIRKNYGLRGKPREPIGGFANLIRDVSEKTKQKVVLLVDEYDKPLLDTLCTENHHTYKDFLRNFYAIIKDCDGYLRFVFLTGVSKFSKIGVFSGLNNLVDLTLDERFADLAGITHEELQQNFSDYIERATHKLHYSSEELSHRLRDYYNGYSWNGTLFVYNPFSLLNFFSRLEFGNYWIESGSSSFIQEYVKTHDISSVTAPTGFSVKRDFSSNFDIDNAPPESFLWQAGYLTIRSRSDITYTLDFPNIEVRSSFSELLLLSRYRLNQMVDAHAAELLTQGLREENFDQVIKAYNLIFSAIPYQLFSDTERFYHSIILTLLWATGIKTHAEDPTSHGRADIVIEYGKTVYVIELKTSNNARSALEALQQIEEKKYHTKYTGKKIVLAGLFIDVKQRLICDVSIKYSQA